MADPQHWGGGLYYVAARDAGGGLAHAAGSRPCCGLAAHGPLVFAQSEVTCGVCRALLVVEREAHDQMRAAARAAIALRDLDLSLEAIFCPTVGDAFALSAEVP